LVTAALPSGARHSRARVLTAVRLAVTGIAVRAITPHRAALANLRSIPLTLAGAGCIDFAAYHIGHGWGWLITGISLVLIEHVIADEP
jgi:hypothetical protein